jgi:hypothetical protein
VSLVGLGYATIEVPVSSVHEIPINRLINERTEIAIMRSLSYVNTAVASLMLASPGAALAQSNAQLLYGTSTNLPYYNPFTITTTVPTLQDPRSKYVVVAEANTNRALEVLAWQDTTSSLVLTSTPGIVNNGFDIAVGVTGLDPGRVVTADVNDAGVLSINTWTVGSAGVVLQNGVSTAPATASQEVAIATLSPTQVVTAFQEPNGTLAVEAWTIGADGLPTAETAIGTSRTANQLSIAAVTANEVVTAIGDSTGSLWLNTWGVDGAGVHIQDQYEIKNAVNNSVTPLESVAVGAGTVFKLVGGGLFPHFDFVESAFTPVITPNPVTTIPPESTLEVYYWGISASGGLTLESTTPPSDQYFVEVAASMLPANVPMTTFAGNAYVNENCGGAYVTDGVFSQVFGNFSDADPCYVTGNDALPSGIATAAAGTDASLLSLFEPYSAYFVSSALLSSGILEIKVLSYPLPPLLF